MYNRFAEELNTSGMAELLRCHGSVLAAYSGGADSTLLLHFLHRYCTEHQLYLYAAHVHHGIRGEEADRDEAHCRSSADALGIPLQVFHVDIPKLAAERSMGLEECARAERYACFDKLCQSLGKPDMPVATAHNADDQLETVLFHMLRGSGLTGMTGITPIRDNRFLRPLLPFSSSEIRSACRELGYAYVEDSTNADTVYTRNYIRNEILPGLRHLTPHPEKAAVRMTELLSRDNDCLETEAAAWLAKARTEDGISRSVLRQVHPAVGTRILRLAFEEKSPASSMTREQTDSLLQMTADMEARLRYLSLPSGVTAEIHKEFLCFKDRTQTEKPPALPPDEILIPSMEPGETVILDWGRDKFVLSRKNLPKRPENLENIYNLSIQRSINFAKIKGVLCLRTRRSGDTIRYRGLSRKIRKLQNEFGTPPEIRETMLIAADAEEILWVEGWEPCDKVRPSGGEEELLWIEKYTPVSSEVEEDSIRNTKI